MRAALERKGYIKAKENKYPAIKPTQYCLTQKGKETKFERDG
jgi:hypothetical protein